MVEVLGFETFDWDLEDEVAVKFLYQNGMGQLLLDEVIQFPFHVHIINVIAVSRFLLVINEDIIFRILFIFCLVGIR